MRIIILCVCITSILGCATIAQGTSQMLTFNIEPKTARCTLMRVDDGQLGTVSSSSNVVTVNKDKDDIVVNCRAPGYKNSTHRIVSAASGGGVTSVFLIDFGITDLATGAFWKYPETHSIVMEKDDTMTEQSGAIAAVEAQPTTIPSPSTPQQQVAAPVPAAAAAAPCYQAILNADGTTGCAK
jgi:hypothetical protein